jgi:hypothetical protein
LKKNLLQLVLRAALVIGGGIAAANAHDARTSISVTATVNAVARLEVASVPTALDITAADVRRGFIDVLEPTNLVVRSNSPAGFTLDVIPMLPMVSSMVISGLGSDQVVEGEGGALIQRWQKGGTANLSLKFRFILVPGLSPGRYPWPMRVAVRPLETLQR